MGFLREKTLEELQEEEEATSAKLSIAEKRALLREAEQRYGGKRNVLDKFSTNGFMSGINWNSLKFRLH